MTIGLQTLSDTIHADLVEGLKNGLAIDGIKWGKIGPKPATADRAVLPQLFTAQGATIDWVQAAGTDHVHKIQLEESVKTKLRHGVHLRWMVGAACGMPTEPFRVWRRTTSLADFDLLDPPVGFDVTDGVLTVIFAKPLVRLAMVVDTGPQGAAISAIRGTPLLSGLEMPVIVPVGQQQLVVVSSGYMIGCALAGITKVHASVAITVDRYASQLEWELVETVGLPVDPGKWSGVGGWSAKQGLAGAFAPPRDAALGRLERGAPPFGWASKLPSGTSAPLWTAPDLNKLLDELADLESGILDRLHAAMLLPPDQQAGFKQSVPMPPHSVSGLEVPPSNAMLPPLGIAQIAGSSDPFLALALGFGTALPRIAAPDGNLGGEWKPMTKGGVGGGRGQLEDYLVTALWKGGLSGNAAPFELAACVPSPGPAWQAPEPSNLGTMFDGLQQPQSPDAPWRATVVLQWDRLPKNSLIQVASVAACRAGSLSMQPLLEQRPSGGWRPIAATAGTNPDGTEPTTLQIVDSALPCFVDSATQAYAVTQQTLFGLWGKWAETSATVEAPEAQVPSIVSAKLVSTPGANHADPCPTELTVEIVYDWSVRRPDKIEVVGRLFAAPNKSTPPPTPAVPSGLQRSIGVNGAALAMTFDAEHPSAAGATVTVLSPDTGEPVAETFGVVRRYRVVIPGLLLDYSSGHVGMVLFARAVEHVGGRISKWTQPFRIVASDPRPPVPKPLPVPRLASLPDAAGECHVRLHWEPAPGATGYFIYEATETAILAARNLPDIAPGATLQDRLQTLQQAFDANPSRVVFTRRTQKPVTGTSIDLTLPRGSTVYHAFVICAHSAGQVESAWPTHHEAVQFIVTPRVMIPAPPKLELRLEGSKVRVLVTPREGPRIASLEIFRIRLQDAARDIDLMGPPALTVKPGDTGAETVTEPTGTWIIGASILDTPTPSWRPWWYRAQVWTKDHDPLGWRRGRSPSSMALSILVPPETPPVVQALSAAWPGGPVNTVKVAWSCASPVAITPIGPHRLEIEFGDGKMLRTTLDQGAPGLARNGADYTYGFERTSLAHQQRLFVRVIDPLGRTGEAFVDLPAGQLVQPVVIIGPGGAFQQSSGALTPHDSDPPSLIPPKPPTFFQKFLSWAGKFFGLGGGA